MAPVTTRPALRGARSPRCSTMSRAAFERIHSCSRTRLYSQGQSVWRQPGLLLSGPGAPRPPIRGPCSDCRIRRDRRKFLGHPTNETAARSLAAPPLGPAPIPPPMDKLSRIVAIVLALGDLLAFGLDLATSPSLKGNAVIGTIVSWEAFRLAMIGMGIVALAWGMVPMARRVYASRARKRKERETAEAERRAAAERAEREQIRRTIAPVVEFIDLMKERDVMSAMYRPHFAALPLRRVMKALFKRVNEPADEDALVRAFALLRGIDKIGLLPGGMPPLGEAEDVFPEHAGLDLDWPRELKRIHDFHCAEDWRQPGVRSPNGTGIWSPPPTGLPPRTVYYRRKQRRCHRGGPGPSGASGESSDPGRWRDPTPASRRRGSPRLTWRTCPGRTVSSQALLVRSPIRREYPTESVGEP